MWDLIVSVPDHCLSFYFATSYNLHTEILSELRTPTESPEAPGSTSSAQPVLTELLLSLRQNVVLVGQHLPGTINRQSGVRLRHILPRIVEI